MEFIDNFEKHYDYDCSYMRKLATSAPKAFESFVNFLPMGQIGESLPTEVLWTAKISAMLTEDCGACVQLNIKMAIEAGVSVDLVKMIIANPEKLSKSLKEVYSFAFSVAKNEDNHAELYESMSQKYTAEQISEMAIAIASTKVYPTIKRSLGEFKSCRLYQFEF